MDPNNSVPSLICRELRTPPRNRGGRIFFFVLFGKRKKKLKTTRKSAAQKENVYRMQRSGVYLSVNTFKFLYSTVCISEV